MTANNLSAAAALSNPSSSQASLITYPCVFPIKVLGLRVDGFVPAMTELAQQFDPQFDTRQITLRESSKGRYLGVTLAINATSRAQLDQIYQALSTHALVKVVL